MTDAGEELGVALARLASDEVEPSVRAVEELATLVTQIVDAVVEEFVKPGPRRYLIFERLVRFGSLVIRPLEDVLARSADDPELETISAIALMFMGSHAGREVVLRAVDPDEPLVCLAVRALAKGKLVEAVPLMEQALLRCDLDNRDVISCLVDGLREFGELSETVKSRLADAEPVWFRRYLLKY